MLPRRQHFADDRKPPSRPPSSTDPIQLGAPPNNSTPSPPPPGSIEAQIQQVAEKHRRAEAEAAAAAKRKAEAEEAAREEAEAREKVIAEAAERAKKAAAETKAAPQPEPVAEPAPQATPLSHGEELPSASEHKRSQVSKKLAHVMDNLQSHLFVASQHINDLTGYSAIDGLKRDIITQETRLAAAQEEVRTSRLRYKQLVADRAASQREVTTLLARKDTWTPVDLERFTSLYRSDHTNEQAVQNAAQHLADVERNAEQAASKLNASILARYHEEQIWSDKIRRMSTWGTWGLMGVNVLLFLVFQFGFEPWRRERLTRGFEDKVRKALEIEREVALAESARLEAERRAEEAGKQPLAMMESQVESEDLVAGVAPEVVAAIEEYVDNQPPETDEVADGTAILTPIEVEEETTSISPKSEAEKPTEEPIPSPASSSDVPESPTPPSWAWDDPSTWKAGIYEPALARFQDLFSQRVVQMRMQDITMVALEGVATGAAVATVVAMWALRPR